MGETMNEHKTATFVAKAAWLTFLALAAAIGLGQVSLTGERWPWFAILCVAVIASCICAAPPVAKAKP